MDEKPWPRRERGVKSVRTQAQKGLVSLVSLFVNSIDICANLRPLVRYFSARAPDTSHTHTLSLCACVFLPPLSLFLCVCVYVCKCVCVSLPSRVLYLTLSLTLTLYLFVYTCTCLARSCEFPTSLSPSPSPCMHSPSHLSSFLHAYARLYDYVKASVSVCPPRYVCVLCKYVLCHFTTSDPRLPSILLSHCPPRSPPLPPPNN